jgi:DNA-binding transcriptional ArsR family regulator
MKNLDSPSPVQVLQVLSDPTSVAIMNAVAENVSDSGNIRELLGLTSKQYYMRYSRLLKIGIIKRKNARLTLTSFGQLIYQALLKIATAFRHSRELIMIDAIKSTAGMPHNEQKDLIDNLILDDEIKKLFP